MHAVAVNLRALAPQMKKLRRGSCKCMRVSRGARVFCRRYDGRVELHGACRKR